LAALGVGKERKFGTVLAVVMALSATAAIAGDPADLVVTGGRTHTSGPARLAEAIAVAGGRLVYVGSAAGARDFVGPKTQVRNSRGAFVLPGLVDAHPHPIDTLDLKVCDLDISRALTRHVPGSPALNPTQAISIDGVLQAYTINGARWQGIDHEAGSLEVGKSADFVVVDRDLLRLAAAGHADDIAATRVRDTWFMGRRVYRAQN
jgi:predicted amidohydrolase YtcJ